MNGRADRAAPPPCHARSKEARLARRVPDARLTLVLVAAPKSPSALRWVPSTGLTRTPMGRIMELQAADEVLVFSQRVTTLRSVHHCLLTRTPITAQG